MTDSLGFRRKFAVIAPSTNTSVQPEFDAMAPRGITNHFGRISIPNDPIHNDDDFAHGHCEPHAVADPNDHADSHAEPDAYDDAHADPDADPHSDTHRDADHPTPVRRRGDNSERRSR